jgi:hypothetical protein
VTGGSALVAARLVTAGLGTLGTDLFEGNRLPPSPDVCTVLADYPGKAPEFDLGSTGVAREALMVQLRYRAGSSALAEAGARAAYLNLAQVVNQTVAAIRVLAMTPSQPPYCLDSDDGLGRVTYAFNVEVSCEPTAIAAFVDDSWIQ